MCESRESPCLASEDVRSGRGGQPPSANLIRAGKADAHDPATHGHGKSDRPIRPEKLPDKMGQSSLYTALMACVIVSAFGFGHRALEARYGNARKQHMLVDPNALARLPHAMGDWTGQDISSDEHIMAGASIDAYINRVYLRSKSGRPIVLYIGCGCNIDVLGHRPNLCYLGSGWSPCVKRKGGMSLNNATMLPYNIYKYTREDTTGLGIVLLHLFVVDGNYYTDVSQALRKSWGPLRSASYYAQVQIGIQSDVLMNISYEDEELLTEFAEDVLPYMNRMFENLLEQRGVMDHVAGDR